MFYRWRAVIILVAALAAPPAVEAQQAGKVWRIGSISMRSGPSDNPQLEPRRALD